METYQSSIGRFAEVAAVRLAPTPRSIDVMGNDREDYKSILFEKGLFSKNEMQDEQEKMRWGYTVVRNQMISHQRKLCRSPVMTRYGYIADTQMYSGFESRMMHRDILKQLRMSISSGEWGLLVTYCENGCNTKAAWESRGKPQSYSGFSKKITRIREHCQKIIKKLMRIK